MDLVGLADPAGLVRLACRRVVRRLLRDHQPADAADHGAYHPQGGDDAAGQGHRHELQTDDRWAHARLRRVRPGVRGSRSGALDGRVLALPRAALPGGLRNDLPEQEPVGGRVSRVRSTAPVLLWAGRYPGFLSISQGTSDTVLGDRRRGRRTGPSPSTGVRPTAFTPSVQ